MAPATRDQIGSAITRALNAGRIKPAESEDLWDLLDGNKWESGRRIRGGDGGEAKFNPAGSPLMFEGKSTGIIIGLDSELPDFSGITGAGDTLADISGGSSSTLSATDVAAMSDSELIGALATSTTNPFELALFQNEIANRPGLELEAQWAEENRLKLLAGGGGNGNGNGVPSGIDPFEVGPYTRFLKARGLPITPGSTADRYMAKFAQPVYDIWDTQQGLNAAEALPGVTPVSTSFETAARAFGGRQEDLRSSANSVLRRLANIGEEGRALGSLDFEREFDPITDKPSGGRSDLLASLIQSGLADRYGRRGASYISRNLGNYRQAYEGQRLAGTEGLPTTYFDYIRNRFGGF